MINFTADICNDFDSASSREWLETNGIGGYSCSTVAGANTRRYHGLLTAAARPPLGRVRMLSKFEERLVIGGREHFLSANQFPGKVYPEGFLYLTSFRLDPYPVWTFQVGEVTIRKTVFLVHGRNASVCRWEVVPGLRTLDEHVELEIRPLLSFCDYHALQNRSASLDFDYLNTDHCVWLQPAEDLPEFFLNHNAYSCERTGDWHRNFEYTLEKERGFDHHEDLFQPFSLRFDLTSEAAVAIAATEQMSVLDASELEEAEVRRRRGLCEIAGAEDEMTKLLVLAADQFIVSRGEGQTIIAGYPWFSDWGRDSMISLAGLTLATHREGIARSILEEFSEHISEGMIPNRFPDEGEAPEYNTVDATLWFFEAARAYAATTGDLKFIKASLYEKLTGIVESHLEGTRFGIKVDEDGLLRAGEDGTQLTWMDAKFGEEVFTPRIGKPVEIQALWYNALKTVEEFADRFKDKSGSKKHRKLAKKARRAFNKQFWNQELECLFDVVADDAADASLRPNQIFAVSLKHSMLSLYRAKKVVQMVERELFTPFGLRSLAPGDPAYRSIYIGGPFERDSAYHQGTVWAWLMGPFIDSLRRTYPKGRKLNQYIDHILECFEEHMFETGLGQISEIFDGSEPHRARGCFAQAWSVAEILRVAQQKSSPK